MTRAPTDLTRVVRTDDVRGPAGSELTPEIAAAFGAAFADECGAGHSAEAGPAARVEIVVGHDLRDSSSRLARAFSDGIRARGANVAFLGRCSTDESYFASGRLQAPVAMFTGSRDPSAGSGIRFSRAGAQAIGRDTGLGAIGDRAGAFLHSGMPAPIEVGRYRELDVLADYAAHLRRLVDLRAVRPLRMVVDGGNGIAALTVPAVLGTAAGLPALPIDIVPVSFDLDTSDAASGAGPTVPGTLADLQPAVVQQRADIGLAFDGDGSRCVIVDERGESVSPSAVMAILALREVTRVRALSGESEIHVLHNLIASRAVTETIERAGAVAVRTRVGNSALRDAMRETGAVVGGEHSAHYYFRDFWGADSGMLAAMHLLAELGSTTSPLSELARRLSPYAQSGEIDCTVDDIPAAYHRIVTEFAGESLDELDGLTVSGATGDAFWWFNVRPSATQPLLRLNVEAGTAELMAAIRDRALALIRA